MQASLFRRAVLRAHMYPFPIHVTLGFDLTKPLGMVVDDDLYVIDEVSSFSTGAFVVNF